MGREMKTYCIYMMTNNHNTALYIGVTGDLERRVYEHKHHLVKGCYTDRYNCEKLVYIEEYSNPERAILRESQLKNWKRAWKDELIDKMNPERRDLAFGW